VFTQGSEVLGESCATGELIHRASRLHRAWHTGMVPCHIWQGQLCSPSTDCFRRCPGQNSTLWPYLLSVMLQLCASRLLQLSTIALINLVPSGSGKCLRKASEALLGDALRTLAHGNQSSMSRQQPSEISAPHRGARVEPMASLPCLKYSNICCRSSWAARSLQSSSYWQ